MDDPRASLGFPAAKPLDDWILHELMRIARDLQLPVQIHTGHMAGIRNDATKTNAAHFRSVLELHQEVRFDLFHGNWPYAGDWLYLAKNYPNVALDCCWLHVIDSRYARRVLADSLVTVPHSKVHGFGGDYGLLEYACGHLVIARDNIAAALAEMVDDGWIGLDEARQVAADWLFNNPNEFFKLGYEPVTMG
jgi:predicted TIM-barrel fold metal-dependent hydrolase